MRMLFGAALVCLVAAGCGGVEHEPNLAAAADRFTEAGTGRFSLDGVQKTDEKPVAYHCTGSADYAMKSVQVGCRYADLGTLEAIAIGGDVYVSGDWPPGLVPGDGKWAKSSRTPDEDSSLANLSPQRLLALLRRSSSETVRVGEEDVRGTETVRYRLTVDCGHALLECKGTAPVEVWIGDDGFVRRISLDDDSGTATFEFFDFGADVDVAAPPAGDVIEEDLVAGGSSGGGTSGGIEVTCADGEAVPISQPQALAALRRNGFRMRDDEFCIVDNGGSNGDLPAEGLVTCGIDAVPRPGAPERVTFGIETGKGVDATLELRNVKCTIETGPDGRQRKIDALGQAFTELQQAIRP